MKLFISFLLLISQLASLYAQKEILTSAVDWPLGLEVHNDILYIVEADSNRISKLDLSIPNAIPEIFVTDLDSPTWVELNGDDLYIAEQSSNVNTGKIIKIDLTETNPDPVTVVSGLRNPKSLLLINTELYFSESNMISKLDLTEPSATPIRVYSGLSQIINLATDGVDLYFSEYVEDRISKINLNVPSTVPIPVLTGLDGPSSAMMILEGELYFFEYGISTISVVDIDTVGADKMIFDTGVNGGDILIYDNDIYVSDFVNDLVIRYGNVISSIENPILSTFDIFPNPTTAFLEIKGKETELDFLITTTSGELVSEYKNFDGNRIDVSALASGTYVLVFENGEAHRFVKL